MDTTTLDTALAGPLAALAEHKNFILWQGVPDPTTGKINKIPISPLTFRPCDAHDSTNRVAAPRALQIAQGYNPPHGGGVGFVFTADDPFFFLDIDACKTPAGEWSAEAAALCARFPDAALEVSQSGAGLHIIGTTQPLEHGCKNSGHGLELYTSLRFIALTGTGATGSAASDHTATLAAVAAELFPASAGGPGVPEEWNDAPIAEYAGKWDDDQLIQKACSTSSAAAAFNGRATFNDLWTANPEPLSRTYPDNYGKGRTWDGSDADAALASHLAFWTGNHHERISRLMLRSGLVRDKWAERPDYLPRTISRVVFGNTRVYTGGSKPSTTDIPGAPPEGVAPSSPMGRVEAEVTSGYQYLAVTQQLEHFKSCVYVRDMHRVFTPDGGLLKAEQFRAVYGGYVFAMDNSNSKTTRSAWEAFTESQAVRFPKVTGAIFKPDKGPGAILTRGPRSLVNTYVPIETPRQKGDPSPFLNHLAKLLPDQRDRDIFLAYMAAVVQHKGVKFQWCPLIQGVEGNGKTLFTSCVAAAIGDDYTHLAKAAEIDSKFNAWLSNRIFIGVEDVYVPDTKTLVIEILKPMITGGRQEVQAKGMDQYTTDICANFILNSNHKDAIRKSINDRRFAIFYTAQQEAGDLARDKMGGSYFPTLYRWLKREGGYAIVAQYLETYAIPDELNPAIDCHRAPVTTSTAEAVALSLGAIEQEILEAIDEERVGFAGGWISSLAVDRLLDTIRASRRIPPRKRGPLLQSLGYQHHPALSNGRVNNTIQIDGGKPRLYVKREHIALNITNAADVARAYVDAQAKAKAQADTDQATAVFKGQP